MSVPKCKKFNFLFHKLVKIVYNVIMEIFLGKNWKYNICFDNIAYKEVKHHSFLYTPKEREIFDFQIEWYRKNFSFEQVLKSFNLLKTDEEIAEFKSAVLKRKKNILYIPGQLKQHYLELIDSNYAKHAEFLKELLIFACNKKCSKNPMIKVYRKIFGCYYAPMRKKIFNYMSRRCVKPKIDLSPIDYKSETRAIIKQLSNDILSQGIWGEYDLDTIRLEQNSDAGKGKFISKYLYPGSTEAYLIQTNGKSLNLEDLKLSIYGNIYPGRGHFLNQVLYKRSYNFDCGAEYIIHGWSTFAAWHIYNTAYSKYSKVLYSKMAGYLLDGNWQDNLSRLYVYLLAHFTQEEALNYLILITQYPGKFESYVMGAIVTELLIAKKFATCPMGLLDEYKKRNVADLFALFKPNTNPC